jgi:hypothetical protein
VPLEVTTVTSSQLPASGIFFSRDVRFGLRKARKSLTVRAKKSHSKEKADVERLYFSFDWRCRWLPPRLSFVCFERVREERCEGRRRFSSDAAGLTREKARGTEARISPTGDSVMAAGTGRALIVYEDGCKVDVSSETAVVSVQQTSPCKGPAILEST